LVRVNPSPNPNGDSLASSTVATNKQTTLSHLEKRHFNHQVTAANYFGDEGAHVAKCLWLVEKEMSAAGVCVSPEDDDETVSAKVDQALNINVSAGGNRAEALGKRYAQATDLIALDAYTAYPGAKGLVAAKVLSKAPHSTNPKWNVVQLQIGPDSTNQATVVCGGLGYDVDDVVAYAPVGIKFNKKAVIPMPMEGVTSCGIMAAYKECGADAPADVVERTKAVLLKQQEEAAAALAAAAPAPAAPAADAAGELNRCVVLIAGCVSMFVIYVAMYLCACIDIYTCIHACNNVSLCVYLYPCMYIRVCMYPCMYQCMPLTCYSTMR
jgi:tRNA-binding EMAP/Myf-like protein